MRYQPPRAWRKEQALNRRSGRLHRRILHQIQRPCKMPRSAHRGYPGSARNALGADIYHSYNLSSTKVLTQDAIKCFKDRWNQNVPERIIIFRDGVSEGEYARVLQNEMQQVTGAS